MLEDWWTCPKDGTGEPGWTHDWPAEQGCLWRALVNATKWAHACVYDWDTEFIGTRPSWVHHLTSGSYSAEARSTEVSLEAVRYFLHSVKQTLQSKQTRLAYSDYSVVASSVLGLLRR